MSVDILGYSKATLTDFFYNEDILTVNGVTTTYDASGGWPHDFFLDQDAAMAVGDIISVTVNMWAPGHSPAPAIGHFDGPTTFINELAVGFGAPVWTALPQTVAGNFWSQTWFRTVDSAMLSRAFVDVLIPQTGGVDTSSGGADGGEVYVVGWRGAGSLVAKYGIGSFGSIHVPDTTELPVLHFFVGGGGVAPDGSGVIPSVAGTTFSDVHYTLALDDNRLGAPTFAREWYGVGLYMPSADATAVGYWTTPGAESALLVGIGPPLLVGTIAASAHAGGIVRHKSIVGA